MNKNYILFFMVICYIIPIFNIYYHYNGNTTISSIICNDKCKYTILFFMLLMGIGTILYEIERNDVYSLITISLILIATYGLICINEKNKIHYVFTFIVLINILFFMIYHYSLKKCNILLLSVFLQILVLFFIMIKINENIFLSEVIYLSNFGFYYLYLHFHLFHL